MKTLKLVAASLLIAASIGNFAYAGEKGKKHHCTEACHKDGKCVLAHGEKGHKCTDACKIPHGDKGHVCTDACKKKM